MSIYRPTVTRKRDDGTTYRTKSKTWRGRYVDPKTGARISISLKTRDRSAAMILFGEIERKAALEAAGYSDPYAEHSKRPLASHVTDFEASLLGKGSTPRHVLATVCRARKVITDAGLQSTADIAATPIWRFIGKLRDTRFKSRTRNHYLHSIRQFVRWLRDERRIPDDPLAAMGPEAVADEEEAGVFDPAELRELFVHVEADKVRSGMTGLDRRVLYHLAVETGFRLTECRTLTWGDIVLDGDPPFATVTAKRAKNRRRYDQPLTADLVALLVRHKAVSRGDVGRADRVLTYMPTNPARTIRGDMIRAGIEIEDAMGRPRNFHSLRHSFATNLARSGVTPKDSQELMRHSDINLTLKRYTHLTISDRVGAISKLPSLTTSDAKRAHGAA